MKITIDPKKGVEAVSGALQKTAEIGKKTVDSVQQGVKALSDKSRNDAYLRKIEKYNPVFPEQYESEEFHIPNMIVIVDDAVRRGIDVCEGAIGWLSKEKVGKTDEIEIFHLYDETADKVGLKFVPAAVCDAVYYMDAYDHTRFVRTDCIFDIAHKERMEELAYIANCLGAKKCVVEISEMTSEKRVEHKKVSLSESLQTKFGKATSKESAEKGMTQQGKTRRSGRIESEFKGSDKPRRPKLKWFAHDEGMLRLIDMVCSGKNAVERKTLELSGSTTASMSQKAAQSIDAAVGKLASGSGGSSMESQLITESETKLTFTIEF